MPNLRRSIPAIERCAEAVVTILILTLTPAYGRDYTIAEAVKADWLAGKDFQSDEGYVNKGDSALLREAGVRWLHIRFKCLSQVCVVRV